MSDKTHTAAAIRRQIKSHILKCKTTNISGNIGEYRLSSTDCFKVKSGQLAARCRCDFGRFNIQVILQLCR